MSVFHLALAFSSLSFLGYGLACLFMPAMKGEFKRYGLSRQRYLTGALELAGAIGLLFGFWLPVIGFLAAAGLCLLMFFGLLVRLRIRDKFLQSLPALLYLILNAYLAEGFYRLF